MAEPILRNYRVQQHKNLSPPLLPSTCVRLVHESISVGSPPRYFVQCHLLCWIHTLHRRGVSTPECLLAAIQSQVEQKVRVRISPSLSTAARPYCRISMPRSSLVSCSGTCRCPRSRKCYCTACLPSASCKHDSRPPPRPPLSPVVCCQDISRLLSALPTNYITNTMARQRRCRRNLSYDLPRPRDKSHLRHHLGALDDVDLDPDRELPSNLLRLSWFRREELHITSANNDTGAGPEAAVRSLPCSAHRVCHRLRHPLPRLAKPVHRRLVHARV
jgi:hypothetical protein